MNMQAAAMAMLAKDRKEQDKAARLAFLARDAMAWDGVHHEDASPFATAPRVKRRALGDKACGPMREFHVKPSKLRRLARRAAERLARAS